MVQMVQMVQMTMSAARKNVGLTQKQAADLIGISARTLGSWECGTTFPGVDMIPKICEVYGVTYDNIKFLPNNPL